MIMKKEDDRLALADIKNRIDVDTRPHLQTFVEEQPETRLLTPVEIKMLLENTIV